MRDAFLVLFATLAMAGTASSAIAQSAPHGRVPCHNYAQLAKQLDQRYHEAPISIGMQSNGNMLQVFANAEQDSWTILSVSPDGVGCILAAGNNWQSLKRTTLAPET